MNIRQIALTATTIMLLAITPAWADRADNDNDEINECHGNSCGGGNTAHAPEINATSGTNALVLLIGGLLLAGEKYRSRQS